jgi:hypothetical protein
MKGILPISLISLIILCTSCKNPFTYQQLKYSAAYVNKKMPGYNEDSSIRFDKIVVIPDDTVVFERTLLKNKNWSVLKVKMEKEAIDSMRSGQSFKMFRENNVSIIFNFRDRQGNPVFSICVTPDKYKK